VGRGGKVGPGCGSQHEYDFRSPGCILTTFLTVPYFYREHNLVDLILSTISVMLVFWNGQYYMKKTCVDYGRKFN